MAQENESPEPDGVAEPAAPPEPARDRPSTTWRNRILVGVLAGAVGLAAVVQVRSTSQDQFSSLRQDDLVRLLDEVTRRNEELTLSADQLRQTRSELQSGTDRGRYLQNYATLQAILAGTVPVEGPGLTVDITDDQGVVRGYQMVHMLEELRNAGAEAIEVSGVRLGAGSYFIDTADGVVADGHLLTSPYQWRVIGDGETIRTALDIPGGALGSFRTPPTNATVDTQVRDLVQITAIREVTPPEYATPDPADG